MRVWLYFVVCFVVLWVFFSVNQAHTCCLLCVSCFSQLLHNAERVGFPGPLALFPVGSFYPGSLGAPMDASGSEGVALPLDFCSCLDPSPRAPCPRLSPPPKDCPIPFFSLRSQVTACHTCKNYRISSRS